MIKLIKENKLYKALPFEKIQQLEYPSDRRNLMGIFEIIINRLDNFTNKLSEKEKNKILIELKNNLTSGIDILQKDKTINYIVNRNSDLYEFFYILSKFTLLQKNYELEFIFNLMQCLKPWQLAQIDINNLEKLINYYQKNPYLIACPVEKLSEYFDWRDFSYDPSFELVEILFAKFAVPPVFIKLFYKLNREEHLWFRHVLLGKNIRHAKMLPVKMTRNAAHMFFHLKPEEEDNINSSLRISKYMIYVQLLSAGVSKKLAIEFLKSRISKDRLNFNFWQNVFIMFTNQNANPEIVWSLIDYILYCRRNQGSSFSIKGRTLDSLVRASEIWHRNIFAERTLAYTKNLTWDGADISDFTTYKNNNKYIIKQLLSSLELYEEGLNMHHCVYGYSGQCKSGHVSIWSLGCEDENGNYTRMLTMEVMDNFIVQVKGKYNRQANPLEMLIIQRWANLENLNINNYL